MKHATALHVGDSVTAEVIGNFGKSENFAGLHVFLRKAGASENGNRPETIVLLSSGPVAMYPPGSAISTGMSSVRVSGPVPGAIVGGTYRAAYAIFFFKDGSPPKTVVGIDPDGDFSRSISDDPPVSSGPPTVTDID
ncbi:MAG: hypothetical protein NVSMB64_21680 [Candidatus Velthaea sp.]